MPAKNSRLQLPRHVVTAVLVAHDGARWLPATLAALAALSRPPQALVAVDTGSADGSAALLADALGDAAVVHCARDTGFGAAVQAGLQAAAQTTGRRAPPAAERGEWGWLLHDHAAPAPGARLELRAEAER
jgi:GT2 family glycosyltransferase